MKSLGNGLLVHCVVGDLALGIALDRVQEINRLVDVTQVPRASDAVRGLINLRGSLVTVLDLGVVLQGTSTVVSAATRTVIVELGDERIGLLVAGVGDVVDTARRPVESLPQHMSRAQARWFRGLVQLERELLLVLDIDAVCATEAAPTPVGPGRQESVR